MSTRGSGASGLLSHRLARRIDAALVAVAAFGLLLMMVHIALDILSSLLLNTPVPLTNALVTEYYMIAVAILPIACAECRRAHISVELFATRLPAGPRRLMEMAMLALGVGVYAMLTVQSWQQAVDKLASKAFVMEQTTQVSVWPSYYMLPIGFGIMALLTGLKLFCLATGKPEPAAEGETEEDQLLERHANG